jgi:hypothetical protein
MSWTKYTHTHTIIHTHTHTYTHTFTYTHTHTHTHTYIYIYIYIVWRCGLTQPMASSFLNFLDHKQRRTALGRTTLAEWSALRIDPYLKTHTTPTRDKHPCLRRVSNPQSQQAGSLRSEPSSARLLQNIYHIQLLISLCKLICNYIKSINIDQHWNPIPTLSWNP